MPGPRRRSVAKPAARFDARTMSKGIVSRTSEIIGSVDAQAEGADAGAAPRWHATWESRRVRRWSPVVQLVQDPRLARAARREVPVASQLAPPRASGIGRFRMNQ